MRRHDFDGLSFAFGLLFAGAGALLLAGVTFSDRLVVPWAGPVVLIVLAIAIVIAARPRSVAGSPDGPGPAAPDDHEGAELAG